MAPSTSKNLSIEDGKQSLFFTVILIALLLSLLPTSSFAQTAPPARTIKLSGTTSTKDSFHGIWLNQIYSEAFRRLGFAFEYLGFPAKRSSYMTDNGILDGEIHRVPSYAAKHPDMIRVEEEHFHAVFAAYATRNDIVIDGWDSLKEQSLKIGHRRGVKKTKAKLARLNDTSSSLLANSARQSLHQLAAGRIDIYIDVKSVIDSAISNDTSLKNQNIHLVGVMEKVSAHSFLHKKNANLVPKLSKVLFEMKQERIIDQMRQTAIKQLEARSQ